MAIQHLIVALDAAELEPESTFWAGVLGGTIQRQLDWHMIMVDGSPRVGIQLAPNHIPPDWPDGEPQQQAHIDLWVDDFPTEHDRVMALGARVLQEAEDTPGNWQVYADPAGHPFCLCWGSEY